MQFERLVRVCSVLSPVVTLLVIAAPALGQATTAPAPISTADDAERWFSVAKAASEAGDVPKAIAALERVLQNDPGLSNIKLELGLLYLRAGNPDLARSYLEQAVNAPDAPEGARVRARQALRTAAAADRRFFVSGTVLVGGQYQSNPNGSPDTVSVTGPGGAPILITGDQLTIPHGGDASLAASAAIELRYDLTGQLRDEMVLNVTTAVNRYARQTEINAAYLKVQLGPRFYLGSATAPDGFFRPYVSATELRLGGPKYFAAIGGGATFYRRIAAAVNLSLAAEYEHRDYNNSRTRSAADEQTGNYVSGSADLIWQTGPRTRLSAGVSGEQVDARQTYWSRTSWGGQANAAQALTVGGGTAWLGRVGAAYQRSDYDDPDPLIDRFRRRREDRTELSASVEVPLRAGLALDLRVQQTWNDATVPNYDYTNSLGALSVSYRF